VCSSDLKEILQKSVIIQGIPELERGTRTKQEENDFTEVLNLIHYLLHRKSKTYIEQKIKSLKRLGMERTDGSSRNMEVNFYDAELVPLLLSANFGLREEFKDKVDRVRKYNDDLRAQGSTAPRSMDPRQVRIDPNLSEHQRIELKAFYMRRDELNSQLNDKEDQYFIMGPKNAPRLHREGIVAGDSTVPDLTKAREEHSKQKERNKQAWESRRNADKTGQRSTRGIQYSNRGGNHTGAGLNSGYIKMPTPNLTESELQDLEQTRSVKRKRNSLTRLRTSPSGGSPPDPKSQRMQLD
jgi:hypothetical protein